MFVEYIKIYIYSCAYLTKNPLFFYALREFTFIRKNVIINYDEFLSSYIILRRNIND